VEGLSAARRDFMFIDAATLATARAEAGALVSGPYRWRV